VTILADIGLATPESAYFDKRRDVYLISNINGGPADVDGNGFITRLTPQGDGEYKIELKFIDGARKGSLLNAPKGLTVAGDILYVADIDRVRKFDALTGAPKGEIVLKGATFVNDVATGENGYVYATDSGLSPQFKGTGTDAVYMISPQDDVRKLISGAELGNPNGVLATRGGVWVVTFGSGELYWVSDTGERKSVQALPQGQNDGLVFTNTGELLISSWAASAVLAGESEHEFNAKISGVTSPADIGYDCTRDRVLIPLFKEDKVVIQQLDK
jgi:sugar lactone lactonase YvrE